MRRVMYKWFILLLFPGLMIFGSVHAEDVQRAQAVPAGAVPAGDVLPQVTARAAIVMEASTGHVLYERRPAQRMFPASTTKMMTLIMALEADRMDDMVTVGRNAAGTEGSTLWLEEGERLRMEELLYGMMMVSGNDATVAIAEHLSGSVPAFARAMTLRAKELGTEGTNFTNPNGLPDEQHYTTAHDLAILAAHGFTLPGFERIVSTKEGLYPWVHDPSHFLRNENQMLWLYEGANGVKTGYTDAAGRCLVSSARKNGVQLIAVVLDADYMWNDSIALLDEGFRHVSSRKFIEAGRIEKTLPVVSGRKKTIDVKAGETLYLPEFDKSEENYVIRYELPEKIHAPIEAGQRLGTLHVMLEGREVASVPLDADSDVEQKSFFKLVWNRLQKICGYLLK